MGQELLPGKLTNQSMLAEGKHFLLCCVIVYQRNRNCEYMHVFYIKIRIIKILPKQLTAKEGINKVWETVKICLP